MLTQVIGILLSLYSMVNEVSTLRIKTKITLAVLAFVLASLPLVLQLYFFVLASRKFGFGFKKYVVHRVLSWLSGEYYDEMMPFFHVKLPPIFSFGDPFGHKLKQDFIGRVLTMNPDDTNSGETFEVYDPANETKADWMDTSNLKNIRDSPYAKEIMFCKYIRNCKLACQYLTYSDTIIIYVGTVDNLQLHMEKCSSDMNTFCVLSQVFNDMEKEDLYIVDDLRGINGKRSHLLCTSIIDLLVNLSFGGTITKVTPASKRYIRIG
ncbi:hypothetical protein Mapa_009540 [Marchantia paleacea]|nr:hypothetical protein Mapa_009540 [Marchantia paleacea]